MPLWVRDRACQTSEFFSMFFSMTSAPGEVSIVCPESALAEDREGPDHEGTDHEGLLVEPGWIALRLEGPFPFAMTGVLASFIQPLAEACIPVFAISTFDTDYVLIKRENEEQALIALAQAGHELQS